MPARPQLRALLERADAQTISLCVMGRGSINWCSAVREERMGTFIAFFGGFDIDLRRDAIWAHPATAVYVLKGGNVKYTLPDGSTKIVELKTGEALIRAPVAHADEALDDVETILMEIKQ